MQLLGIGMEKLGYSRKISQSGWYPQVSLVGSYKKSGGDPWADENDFSDPDGSFVTLQATWNFFTSGKNVARTKADNLKIKALSARIKNYRTQVLTEVRSAVLDCQVAFKNIKTAEKALDQARGTTVLPTCSTSSRQPRPRMCWMRTYI
jgi:outer membrane protein TolC